MSAQELLTQHLDLWTGAVTTRSTAGRGTSSGKRGKIELTGIKKLRELILELAVRGKLVDQDPSDEPASVLLERIAEEKARLVKEGMIKKPKKLPEITEEEVTAKLPTEWTWTRLGEITNYGVTEKAEPGEVEDTTWVLELEDIEKESSRLVQRVTYRDRPFKSSKNRFLAEDVLYGKLRPYLDKVIVADMQGVCTTEIIPIRAFKGVFPAYLRLALKSPTFKQYANNSTHGMNLPRLGTDKAKLALIPLPPKNEQCRIVEKIDELMALCDRLEHQVGDQLEAHEVLVDTLLDALTRSIDASEVAENWTRIAAHFDTLFTTEASIDKLKQTILQLAVMGRLVEQDAGDESGTALLQKILPEVERLIKKGRFKLPKEADSRQKLRTPHPIPLTWTWCTLDQISVVARGGSPRPIKSYLTNDPKGFSWIKIGDAMKGSRLITQAAEKIIPEGLHKTRMVYPGDLILSNSMSFGQPYILAIEGCIHDGWLLLRTPEHLIDKVFLYYLLLSPYAMKAFSDSAAGAVVQNLNADKVRLFQVPLPPKEEQHRIVEKVDELLALCERLKARLGEAGETRTHLAEAVAEQAVH